MSRLNFNLNLAQTPAFTHGPLFTEAEIKLTQGIKEEDDQELKVEEDAIDNEIEENKKENKNNYWESIDDLFYDRL